VQEGLNILAGETVADGNVITANGRRGVFLGSGSTSSFVLGNKIGTDRNGALALGNDGPGIEILGTDINFVQANTVAFNLSDGVHVDDGQRNTLRRNSIYSNTGVGITLTNSGNAQLAAPALVIDPATGISGSACAGCTVEVFADAADEGRFYLSSRVTDEASGFAFGRLCPMAGLSLTATATDGAGNTSEFSAPQSVTWTCSFVYLPLLLRQSP
jgi:parallel beta-helix repeat protein